MTKLQMLLTFVGMAWGNLVCPDSLRGQDPMPPAPIISVTLLGTGTPNTDPAAYIASGQVTAGLMVVAGSERMLFDCGQGILTRLLESGNTTLPANSSTGTSSPNAALDKVFISHLHSDHIADLPSLYSYGWLFRNSIPLQVWGPGPGPNSPFGTGAIGQLLRQVFDADITVRAQFRNPHYDPAGENPYVFNELNPGIVYARNGVTVTAFLVDHSPVTPAYGFRIDYQGHSVVYSGDTKYVPGGALQMAATGADLLIHEVYGFDRSASPEVYDYHTSPEDAAKLFNAALPKQIVYTHQAIPSGTNGGDLVSRTRIAGYVGPLVLGADLMVINVLPSFSTVVNPIPHSLKADMANRR
jgi:ribonuclease Z